MPLFHGVEAIQLHEVVEVIEASSASDADVLLASGWKLVAVVAGDRYASGQLNVGPIYVLGKPAPAPEMAKSINVRFPT